MNEMMAKLVEYLTAFAGNSLLSMMGVIFFIGIMARSLVYYTVSREESFVFEFEKRIFRLLDFEKYTGPMSFYAIMKRLMQKTFYELFEIRSVMRRRKLDHIMAPTDRLFLVQSGCAYLVRDTLKRTKQLKFNEEGFDELKEVSAQVLATNPCFSRILGIFPLGPVNELLDKLPGLFIVMGIFGTFLGIMNALPELAGMDLNDTVGTKAIMDAFLAKVSHSMVTSALGILFSILFQVFNALFNPERLFADVVEKFHNTMIHLWRRSESNVSPEGMPEFDEHRDPVDALAELALQKEISAYESKHKTKQNHRDSFAPPAPQTSVHQQTGGLTAQQLEQLQQLQKLQQQGNRGSGNSDGSGNKVA